MIESKPPADVVDLRVAESFEELTSYCNSMDLPSLSDRDHAHVPYIVILVKALQEWKTKNVNVPSNQLERDQVRLINRSISLSLLPFHSLF